METKDSYFYQHKRSQTEMNNNSLLAKPEVLLGKLEIGDKIGVQIPRENGFQFPKIWADELPYIPIGVCQTYSDKIKFLIWDI